MSEKKIRRFQEERKAILIKATEANDALPTIRRANGKLLRPLLRRCNFAATGGFCLLQNLVVHESLSKITKYV